MFNYHSNLYKNKQKLFFHIFKNYKYIQICRYNELDPLALANFKLDLKKDQIYIHRLKQTVINSQFKWLKAQNSLFLIYSNNKTSLDLFFKLKKYDTQTLYLQFDSQKIISNLKLQKNLKNLNKFNPILLKNHYLIVNYLLNWRI